MGPMPSGEKDGNNGLFMVPLPTSGKTAVVIISDGLGWEHLSVSLPNRVPNWEEMCYLKDLFWDEEDIVVQYHPRKSEYINNHNFTLHLWRPLTAEMPAPPSILVGI